MLGVAAAWLALAAKQPTPLKPASVVAQAKRELTPAAAVATVRVMQNQLPGSQEVGDHGISPDGRRYLLRLAHGDEVRNGVWVDILTGSVDSLESAQPRLCAHLFTTGLGSNQTARAADADPSPTNLIKWLSNSQIAFLWSDPDQIRQVLSVDLSSCKHRWLTHVKENVYSFAALPDGSLLIDTQVPEPKSPMADLWRRGYFLNESADGWSILEGRIDGTNHLATWQTNWFIQTGPASRAVDVDGRSVDRSNPNFREVSVSPSGHFALAGVGMASTPRGWNRYSNSALQRTLKLSESDRVLSPVRYALINLSNATSRMLWDAPFNVHGRARWSAQADHILLAPTFLPKDTDNPLGLSGDAAAVIDAGTGEFRVLPLDLTGRIVSASRWLSATSVEIDSSNDTATNPRADRFVLIDNSWRSVPAATSQSDPMKVAPIRIETRESLNSPAQVFAVDTRSGKERMILNTNPDLLDTYKLGHVERLSGTLSNGRQWIAQLIYPADYRKGIRYPLLIQSMYARPFGPEEFSLIGPWGMSGSGLGPSDQAAYPGQLLATRNIAVLQLEVLHPSAGVDQAADYQLAFETLAAQLSASGLADESKIGLDGFSQNGYWVEYTLSHSSFPFAAAVAADNYDPSYFQSALSNWRELDTAPNGAPAFGQGLQQWLKHAPGFNAEHIHSPLLMIGQSEGIALLMAKWEIYSRLRALKKPVEFYMMPEANTHPSHIPQNPRQIMAIQEAVIDWFSFWLTDREDSNPAKQAQYARWRAFAASRTHSSPASESAIANP